MPAAWKNEVSLRETLGSAKENEALRKYFEVENMREIFGNIDSDLQALMSKTVEIRDRAQLIDWNELDSYLEALKDLLTIIVDQPYVNYFRSVSKLVTLLFGSNKTSSVRLVMQILGVLIEGNYKHPGSKHLLKLSDSIKAMSTTQAALVSLGFNAYSGKPIGLFEMVDGKDRLLDRCRELVVDSTESSFEKVTIDISRLVQSWKDGEAGFREETTKFIREGFSDLPNFTQELYASAIAWKSQLAAMIEKTDLNNLEDIMLLILQGRYFTSKVAVNYSPEHLAKLRTLQATDVARDSFEELSQLLKLQASSAFSAEVIKNHFSLFMISSAVGQRSSLILSLLADFNQETMRRRSSDAGQPSGGMDIEDQMSAVKKSSQLLQVACV